MAFDQVTIRFECVDAGLDLGAVLVRQILQPVLAEVAR
jgi:hypothetical protein